jgi:hypothetical protein
MTRGIGGAKEQITGAVLAWEGTAVQPHRFGGVEYVLGRREMTKVRDQIVAVGRASLHHLLSESGWVSFYIREPRDVVKAVELLQESYAIAARQKAPRGGEA